MRNLRSIASSLDRRNNVQRSEATLVELDEKTDTVAGEINPITGQSTTAILRFQYFPATITDSLKTTYVSQQVPGGSAPIYQWISSGPRTISFEAIFSCDTDLLAKGLDEGDFLNQRLKTTGQSDRNVDIRSAIFWLRRFMLPRYTTGEIGPVNSLTYPPRKLILVLPNSGIGIAGGEKTNQGSVTGDSIYCHMSQCDVTYQMFHPSGLPKLVKVQLEFEEVAQIGGNVIFPSASNNSDVLSNNFVVTGYFGYNLTAKGRARTSGFNADKPAATSGLVPLNPDD